MNNKNSKTSIEQTQNKDLTLKEPDHHDNNDGDDHSKIRMVWVPILPDEAYDSDNNMTLQHDDK